MPIGMTVCLPLLSRVRMLDGTTMALGPDPALPFVSVSRYISAAPVAGAWAFVVGGAMTSAWIDVAQPMRVDRLCASLLCTHCSLFTLLLVPEAISPSMHQQLSGFLMTGATWYTYEAWRRYGEYNGFLLRGAFVMCLAAAAVLGAMNVAFLTTSIVVGHAYFAAELVLIGACVVVAPVVSTRLRL